MTDRLKEGMEMPDFDSLRGKEKGMMCLLAMSGNPGVEAEKIILSYQQTFQSRDMRISVLVNEEGILNDCPGILINCDGDCLKKLTDSMDPYAVYLCDEYGKIVYLARAEEIGGLPRPEMIESTLESPVSQELLENILNAYPYEIVYADRSHIVRYMNATARKRYGDRVKIGNSLFNCHNERSREKILSFLKRADEGENEMFETCNQKTGEREFFTPVRNHAGKVIGYFERHEAPWDPDHADVPVNHYWKHRNS